MERDARLKKLVLTQKGRELHEGTVKNLDKLEKNIREGISDDELQLFFRLVHQMKLNLEDHNER